MTNPVQIIEPVVEAAALLAGATWLFHTVCRASRNTREHLRLTTAAAGIAFLTSVILEYARFRLTGTLPADVIALGSAMVLLVTGIAWLRPAILLSSGLYLPPSLLAFVPPLRERSTASALTTKPVRQRRRVWPLAGVTVGVFVALLNNGDLSEAASIPVSLLLLLVAWWLAVSFAVRRPAHSNTTLRIIAGALTAALGAFQISENLNLGWQHPASVLWALIAAFLTTAYWLVQTCHDGKPRHIHAEPVHAASARHGAAMPVSTRARNTLLAIEVCVWTAAVGIGVHSGWHIEVGMMDWQVGLLLFAGFTLMLVQSVLIDVILPGGG